MKPWWDTAFCRKWEMTGMLMYLLGKRIVYIGYPPPANDRDHIRW